MKNLFITLEEKSIIPAHTKSPKILKNKLFESLNDFNKTDSYQYTMDDLVVLVVFAKSTDGQKSNFLENFSCYFKGDYIFLGVIDAILYLYEMNKNTANFKLSLREFEFYLRNSPKNPLNLEENKLFVHFFDDFVNWIDKHILRDKLHFSQLTLAEKLVLVEKVVDEEYNLKFNKEGKLINVLDIEGQSTPEIIVEMKGIEGCSVGKELELLQNILIEKLGIEEVNIIPEV